MIHRPDLAHLPEGEIINVDGRQMRHLGNGQFFSAEPDLMLKRFANDGELLLKAG